MNDKLSKDQTDGVLAALDKALAQGPWSASTFLSLIGKKLQTIRDDFARLHDISDVNVETTSPHSIKQRLDSRARMKKIYIALYAFDGSNLQSWERIISNLPSQVISRPVYENEEDVILAIRNKGNPVNEAYVSIYIEPSDILDQVAEKVAVDKSGKPLLALKGKAITLENFDAFVHTSGSYQFIKGRLIKK